MLLPEGFDKAANQEELVRALQTMMSNFKKKTPSPAPSLVVVKVGILVLPLQLLQNLDSFLVFKVTQNQKLHLV